MGAHIFLVGEDNFEVCLKRGVYGCVMPGTERNRAEVVAGVLSIQPEDLVFFYVKNRGIYGTWKVAGEPFYDDTKVWADEEQRYPYRFSFQAALGSFEAPVSLSDILELRDKGRVWTFDLSPVQQKNQYKITTDEAREMLRLLLRNNPRSGGQRSIADPYTPRKRKGIEPDLSPDASGRVRYEGWLNAWFMRAFAQNEMKSTFGEHREFLNLVPTTFNKVIDIFLTHTTLFGPIEVTYKYSCIELKADRADEGDLAQVLRYEDWLARRLAAGDKDMVQTVLVANRFADSAVQYVSSRRRIEEKTVSLITYRVVEGGRSIKLAPVEVG